MGQAVRNIFLNLQIDDVTVMTSQESHVAILFKKK